VERNKTPIREPLSRRELLKVASAVSGAVWLESYLMGLATLLNKDQREVYLSLLKFKAAEVYAWQQGWPLVGETAHHFISGKGEVLDISETLVDSLKISGKEKNVSTQSLLNGFFGPLVSESINQGLPTSQKWSSENIAGGQDFWFVGEVDSTLPDVNLSLHRFGLGVFGRAINPKKSDTAVHALFEGSVKIFDRYDFGTNDKDIKGISFSNTAIELLFRELGVKDPLEFLTRKVGGKVAKEILNSKLGRFSTANGRLLQDSGIGIPYDIVTREIPVSTPVTINLPES
jgi:hypothetical protein